MARSRKQSPAKADSHKTSRTIQKSLLDYFSVRRRHESFVNGIKSFCRSLSFSKSSKNEGAGFRYVRPHASFALLPPRAFARIAAFTSIQDLVNLAAVSKKSNQTIRAMIASDEGTASVKCLYNKHTALSGSKATFFASLGTLMRRCTTIEAAHVRCVLALGFYKKLAGLFNDNDGTVRFLKVLLHDCNDREKYAFLEGFVQVRLVQEAQSAMRGILTGNRDRQQELKLREKVHAIFLAEDESFVSRTFGISAALRLLGTKGSTHLVVAILFAPLSLDGSSILLPRGEEEHVLSPQDIRRYYGHMPGAVCALFDSAKINVDALQWTPREVYCLLEDLTNYPQPWDVDNFAGFILADTRLCLISIGYRAKNKHPDNAGFLLYCAARMSVLFGQDALANLRKAIKLLIRQLTDPFFRKLHEKTLLRCAQNTDDAWRRPGTAAIVDALKVYEEVCTIFANAVC